MVVLTLVLGGCKPKLASQQLTSAQRQLAAELRDVTKTYLESHLGVAGFGGKSFCAYKVMELDQSEERLREFVYAVCQEYYLKNGVVEEGTGLGLPVVLTLRRTGLMYQVVGHQTPGDGGQYSRDVERLFPKQTHREIFEAGPNYTAWKDEVAGEARKYFGK